jgi:glycosyltransferase involved in cell wall biosynthesis
MPRVLQALHAAGLPAEERGCLLHVGGGQWYKNSVGVVRLYAEHVRHCTRVGAAPLPLWLVSPPPDAALRAAIDLVPAPGQVRFCGGIDDELLEALYSHARALLFPSLAEGFGWPIVEALACGCPVITTDEAPMNEIGGEVVTYLPRLQGPAQMDDWAKAAAHTLAMVLSRTPAQRQRVALDSIAWAQRFDGPRAIENHLAIYQRVLAIEAGTSERISLR